MKHLVPRGERADRVVAEERPHRRDGEEELGEGVVVGGPGRRLRVVLGAAEAAVGRIEAHGVMPRKVDAIRVPAVFHFRLVRSCAHAKVLAFEY